MLHIEKAKVLEVSDVQTFGSENQYRKQMVHFIVESYNRKGDIFTDSFVMNVWNERIDILHLKPGEIVNLAYMAEVREYNGRKYNDFSVFDCTPVSATNPAPPTVRATSPADKVSSFGINANSPVVNVNSFINNDNSDDPPF